MGPLSRGGQGYLILEDPPSILSVRIKDVPGRVQWIDLRNYGIDCYPAGQAAHDRAAWLSDTMGRMVSTLSVNGWGSIKPTAGSQAMFTFRRAYMGAPVFVHNDPAALALEKAAYVGGRCEARRIGKLKGPVYHVDFRSLYPAICATLPMPSLYRRTGAGHPPAELGREPGSTLYVGEVTIRTTEPAYPLAPAKTVIYPVGTFRTHLCGPELMDAHKRGRIVAWHRWAEYDGTMSLSAYALGLWRVLSAVRSRADKPLEQWLKSMLVCLPGKFGQHGGTWVVGPSESVARPWSEWYEPREGGGLTRCRAIGWECWREEGDEWGKDACPAVAAWVCSAGRMALLDAIRTAGWDHVLYHDTDSLLVDRAGFDYLMLARKIGTGQLGRLRVIGIHERGAIHGIKHYELDGALTCSGLPRGGVQAGPSPDTYWYRCWMGKDVTRGRAPAAQEVLRRYARTQTYRHGIVSDDGSVRPFTVEEPCDRPN